MFPYLSLPGAVSTAVTIAVAVSYGIIIILDIVGVIDISRPLPLIFFSLTLPVCLVRATLFIANAKGFETVFGIPIAIFLFLYPVYRINRTPCGEDEFPTDIEVLHCGIRRLVTAGIVNMAVYTVYIIFHFVFAKGESAGDIINSDILFVATGYVFVVNACLRAAPLFLEKPEFIGRQRHRSLTKEEISQAAVYYLKRTGQIILCFIPVVNIILGILRIISVGAMVKKESAPAGKE